MNENKKWIISSAYVWVNDGNMYNRASCNVRYNVEDDKVCKIEFYSISNVINVIFDRLTDSSLVLTDLIMPHNIKIHKVGCINNNDITFKNIYDFKAKSLSELLIKLELEGYLYDDPSIR